MEFAKKYLYALGIVIALIVGAMIVVMVLAGIVFAITSFNTNVGIGLAFLAGILGLAYSIASDM